MAKDGDAAVTPDQPWTEDGTATAAPLPPFPETTPRTLSLDNRASGNFTIHRSDYPGGIVIIQTGHEPTSSPATLPIKSSSGSQVQVTGDNFVQWPDGFVIWFLSQ